MRREMKRASGVGLAVDPGSRVALAARTRAPWVS